MKYLQTDLANSARKLVGNLLIRISHEQSAYVIHIRLPMPRTELKGRYLEYIAFNSKL